VTEAGANEVFLGRFAEPAVVAEDKAAGERRLPRRHALPQPHLGPFTDLPGSRHRQGHQDTDPDQHRQ